ncbi:MAG: dihydropteroate synthase [Vicingaceae bacterium]|nr:MAG: dihydropteroate synthase [Vicingaceae bacterium]
MKNTTISGYLTTNFNGILKIYDKPLIMGILNINRDSFYKGSRFPEKECALSQVEKMIEEGADIIDLGYASTRPGAPLCNAEDEIRAITPIVEAIRKKFPEIIISIDTYHASTVETLATLGIHVINDISGGRFDPKMFEAIARHKTAYVLTHSKGTPETMQSLTEYDDFFDEIFTYFENKINHLQQLGIQNIIIDPGIGFAKTINQNFLLLKYLDAFQILGYPVLIGISRKSFIYKTLQTTPEDSLNGTTIMHTLVINKNPQIFRVHDVKPVKELICLYKEFQEANL